MLLLKYLKSYRNPTAMQFMIGKRCSSMRILVQMLPSLTLFFSDASYISSTCKTTLIGCHPQSGGIYRLVIGVRELLPQGGAITLILPTNL